MLFGYKDKPSRLWFNHWQIKYLIVTVETYDYNI